MTNIPKLVAADNNDFLIGDTVVLDEELLPTFDRTYHITEVYENTVDVYINIGILTINKKFVRTATVAEVKAKRRLPEPVALFISGDESIHLSRALDAIKEM